MHTVHLLRMYVYPLPTPDLLPASLLRRRPDYETSRLQQKRRAHLSQNSGETHDLKGVDSEAAREIAAFAGTVASSSDFDVASTAFSPL